MDYSDLNIGSNHGEENDGRYEQAKDTNMLSNYQKLQSRYENEDMLSEGGGLTYITRLLHSLWLLWTDSN